MATPNHTPRISILTSIARAIRLSCPRCGTGHLFHTWITMRTECPHCQLDLQREPGFYLGSIYINYGVTVLLVVPTYMVLVLAYRIPRDYVVWPSALFTILFPLFFFRYARSLWLSLAWQVGSATSAPAIDSSEDQNAPRDSVASAHSSTSSPPTGDRSCTPPHPAC